MKIGALAGRRQLLLQEKDRKREVSNRACRCLAPVNCDERLASGRNADAAKRSRGSGHRACAAASDATRR